VRGKFSIEFSLKFIFQHAGFCGMHHSPYACLRDLHPFPNGIQFALAFDSAQRANQRITVLDEDVRMPHANGFRKFALEIKMTFRRKRIKTQPEGLCGLG